MTFNKEDGTFNSIAKKDGVDKIYQHIFKICNKKDISDICMDEIYNFTLIDIVMLMKAVYDNNKEEIALNFGNRVIEGLNTISDKKVPAS